MLYIANAFSLGMVPRALLHRVRCAPIERPILGGVDFISAVGHADTALLLGVPMARIAITLQPGDTLYIAQYVGTRLPEGTTELPPGARFEWVAVTVLEPERSQ
jgi:hypothetical protein